MKRDRLVVIAGLVLVTALSWGYLLYEAARMDRSMSMSMGGGMSMPQMAPWGAVDLVLLFAMWSVMMVGMMVPSAAPMVLLFAGVNRQRSAQQRPYVPTGIFLAGYLTAWAGFSLLATLAQWGLHSAALLSPMMVSTSPYLGAALLLAGGVFQWTPLKNVCLDHCRSPQSFISTHWREGTAGAFRMGFHHGIFCVGCCWFLMLLLFVTGVMNLLWVAAIAGFVLLEKVAPVVLAPWVSRLAGALLVLWGVFVLLGARTIS